MNADPRAALEVLTVALQRHLEACASRRGDDDPRVAAAYDAVADAFETYDESLHTAYHEMTPLEIYSDDEFDDEDDDLDDDDEYDFDDDDADSDDDDNADDDEDDEPHGDASGASRSSRH